VLFDDSLPLFLIAAKSACLGSTGTGGLEELSPSFVPRAWIAANNAFLGSATSPRFSFFWTLLVAFGA
jgi:hypothetical protein